MYLHLGQNIMVRNQDVVGIFDLDNTTWSFRTRRFLEQAEQEGRVTAVGDDLPRSFVLVQKRDGPPAVYITALSSAALSARSAEKRSVRVLGPERGRAQGSPAASRPARDGGKATERPDRFGA